MFMRILVMIKQVCEPQSLFELADGRIVLSPATRFQLNTYDEYALEAALSLASGAQGEVTALTIGPANAQAVLTRAAGMGAKKCVHLLWEAEAPPSPIQVAALAADWIPGQEFELILTGVMSQDSMNGAVGPMLAALLDLPLATSVVELEAGPGAQGIRAVREMEGGHRQFIKLPTPCLLTIQSSVNQPRYPTLSNLLRAKANPPQVIEASSRNLPPSEVLHLGADFPESSRAGLVLPGSTEEKAAALLRFLQERAFL